MNKTVTIDDLKPTASTAIRKKDFPGMLKAFLPEIQRALPKHLNGDRMARIALTAFRRTPKLASCDPLSVFAAVIQSAQLGLEPDTLGRAYLIPYGRECQFIPGWKGLVELLNRSGQGSAWTGAVFKGDEFDYQLGDSPFVRHKPTGEYDPELLTHVYAIGRPKGCDWPVIEVWPMDRVIKHRDRYNKVGTRHYSYKNPEMYARKVVLLQVLKYLPASAELSTAVELDAAANTSGQHIDLADAIDGTWAHTPDDQTTETSAQKPLHADDNNEATEEKTNRWPENIIDKETGDTTYVDSSGEFYDQEKHGWNREHMQPVVNADGIFRKRRGAQKQTQQAPPAPRPLVQTPTPQSGGDQENDAADYFGLE